MSDNIFYYPEKHGLEQVASIDYSDGNYCFDYRVIWRHKETGKLYTARDLGCSCPSPFENYENISQLEKFSFSVIKEEAQERALSSSYSGQPVNEFIEKISKFRNRRVKK